MAVREEGDPPRGCTVFLCERQAHAHNRLDSSAQTGANMSHGTVQTIAIGDAGGVGSAGSLNRYELFWSRGAVMG